MGEIIILVVFLTYILLHLFINRYLLLRIFDIHCFFNININNHI